MLVKWNSEGRKRKRKYQEQCKDAARRCLISKDLTDDTDDRKFLGRKLFLG